MAQQNRISRNNTRIVDHPDGSRGVVLHRTEVVRWYPHATRPGGRIVLNTGGWRTVTTRTRMMQAAREWDLPYSVSFAAGQFRVGVRGADGVYHWHPVDEHCVCIAYNEREAWISKDVEAQRLLAAA